MARKLLVGLLLGVLVLIGMGIYADGRKLLSSLQEFQWWLLAPVIGLTLLNYLLRFGKWHYYLSLLDARPSIADSGLVFLGGLSMAVTPGKLGELLKAVLLRQRAGVAPTLTASVVISERLTDFLALIVLAAFGVYSSGHGVVVLVISIVGSAAILGCLASQRLSGLALRILRALPLGDRIAPKIEALLRATRALSAPGPLLATTAVSVAAWWCECLGFHLVLSGLMGTAPDLGTATFIYAFATIFGAVTMLPGGLGATEGSLIGLTLAFGLATAEATATAGAMIIRFCTLWFAVLVGLVALAVLRFSAGDLDAAAIDTEALEQG